MNYFLSLHNICRWGVCALLLLWSATPVKADNRPNPYNSPQQKAAFDQRARRLGRLWLSRRQQKVTPELLGMLQQEPTEQLRERTVIALGRMEAPSAEVPLAALIETARQAQKQPSRFQVRDEIPPFRIALALGRIRARDLHGLAKLNKVAQSVNTNWQGIQAMAGRLKTQLQDRKTFRTASTSDEFYIVEEFFDVLYRMGKNGENIRSLGANKLLIWANPSQLPDALYSHSQALVQAASLSDAQEVQFWFKRAWPPAATTFDPAHLLDLGPTVPGQLTQYLKTVLAKAQTHPQVLARTRSYRAAFQAASATGNKQYLPLLRAFEKVDERWMRRYASYEAEQLKIGGTALLFP